MSISKCDSIAKYSSVISIDAIYLFTYCVVKVDMHFGEVHSPKKDYM